ncbi:tRNA(Ile)-lysidine synthase [Frankliniella fusca]|uniref:tRNA(Ile)-lysidine synthase n=1 Tax=Frankliniella fusca TaxID=407009 RepID=A0AAE1H9X6_9NEOP|nr:tRNA(Ile)-lysidine synthase [Frankliniella fusca]
MLPTSWSIINEDWCYGKQGHRIPGKGRLGDSPPPPKPVPQTGHKGQAWQQAAEPEESAGDHFIVCPGLEPTLMKWQTHSSTRTSGKACRHARLSLASQSVDHAGHNSVFKTGTI